MNNQKMENPIKDLALGLLPAGCKFFNEDGSVKMGGEMLALIVFEKSRTGEMVSPCKGCNWFKECQKEGIGKPREDRLNTENLEVGPVAQDKMQFIAGVAMSTMDDSVNWVFNPDEERDPDDKELELPFVVRVIRKRIIAENLKIQITKKAYLLIYLFVENSPGKAMFVLHKIGNFFEKIKAREWLVTSSVLLMSLFPLGFPTEVAFDKWWDGQKMEHRGWSDNKVDIFPNEWRLVN